MKGTLDMPIFVLKLLMINENHPFTGYCQINTEDATCIVAQENKKTKQEIVIEKQQRSDNTHRRLIERYSDESIDTRLKQLVENN
jgi:hypothetical protein